MSRQSLLRINFLALVLSLGLLNAVNAQKQKIRFVPAVEVQVDYLKLASRYLDGQSRWEVGVNVLSKYNVSFSADYGAMHLAPETPYLNTLYETKGQYFRVGANYHIPIDPKYNFYIGSRYGMSMYSERAEFSMESELYEPFEKTFERNDLQAQWAEVVIGSDRKIWKGLKAGMILRYRFLIDAQTFSPLDQYQIPGYGKKFNSSLPAINFFLAYRIGKMPNELKKEQD